MTDESMQRAVRIRTDPDPYEQFLIAQAYRVGNLIFVSGQAATTPEGEVVPGASTLRPKRCSTTSAGYSRPAARRWRRSSRSTST